MKSREILGPEGMPLPEDTGRQIEDFDNSYLLEQNPELKKFLDKIDFDILEDIFSDIAQKAGIDRDKLNFVGPERISPHTLANAGEYRLGRNIIGMNVQGVKDAFEKYHPELDSDLQLLELLTHEETHASVGGTCQIEYLGRGWITGEPQYNIQKSQTGYNQNRGVNSESNEEKFFYLSEGVTEKLGREVTYRYLERTEFKDESAVQQYLEARKSGKLINAYDAPVKFVEMLIHRISKFTDFSHEEVWTALIRGMYEGETFTDQELVDLIKEALGENFLERLGSASIGDLNKMIEEFNAKEGDEKLNSWIPRIKKLLR